MNEHPPIAPPAARATRPFWSVMIPTYEPDATFLRRAVVSVLAQDTGPDDMEIVLVDDGSQRLDPRDALRGLAPERVAWLRQPCHVGIGANWNACLQRARGEWLHLLHQDDFVRPGFYARLRRGIETAPQAGAAVCRDVVVDRDEQPIAGQRPMRATPGIVDDWIEHVFVSLHLRASALVVRRRVYEALGGFRLDLPYALDWDMWKRVVAAYPLWYEPEPLACYRRHDRTASLALQRSGANLADIERSIALSEAALPSAIAAAITRRARENYTLYAAELAWRALAQRDLRATIAQLRGARRLTSTRTLARALWQHGLPAR